MTQIAFLVLMFRNSDAGAGRTADGEAARMPLRCITIKTTWGSWLGRGLELQESLGAYSPEQKASESGAAHDSWLLKGKQEAGDESFVYSSLLWLEWLPQWLRGSWRGLVLARCHSLLTVRLRDARWVKCLNASVLWGGPFSSSPPTPWE